MNNIIISIEDVLDVTQDDVIFNTLSNKQGDIFVAICAAIYTIATMVVVLKLSTRIKPIEE